ncbi:hypothetical protein JCM11251_007653 [Rhodosporidiobolus azoricus]
MSTQRLAGQGPALVLLRSPTEASKDDPYRTAAVDAGFNDVHLLPILSTSFTNFTRLAEVLAAGAEGYDGVVMTSARSAEAWAAAAATLQPSSSNCPANGSASPKPPFFVVGHGTRSALLERLPQEHRPPQESVLGAEETGTGEALARFIIEHFEREVLVEKGCDGRPPRRKLLYLTGDKNRDTLPSILAASSSPEIVLEPLQVYATSSDSSLSTALTTLLDSMDPSSTPITNDSSSSDILNEPPHPPKTVYFALFSPSSALPLITHLRSLSLLPPYPSSLPSTASCPPPRKGLDLRFAAIGPTTRDYLVHDLGVEVHAMAAKPDARSLTEALSEAVRKEMAEEGAQQGRVEGRL